MELRTMKLQPYLWQFILQNTEVSVVERTDNSLIHQFQQLTSWKRFSTTEYRYCNDKDLQRAELNINSKDLKLFWEAPMLLQSRSLWYRVISQKLPTAVYLHKIQIVNSPICRLCKDTRDSFEHFVIYCPIKREIWKAILQHYLPDTPILYSELYSALVKLTSPAKISRLKKSFFFTVISTTQWHIWTQYWRFIMDQKPFIPNSVIKVIHSQIAMLTNPGDID